MLEAPLLKNDMNERVNVLENELHEIRQAMLLMAPEEMQEILQSYLLCKTREEADSWEKDTIQKVVEIANVRAHDKAAILIGQTLCPLCRRGSSYPYKQGYSVPTGLFRHLSGRGHAHHCDVMTAVLHLARESWSKTFKDK